MTLIFIYYYWFSTIYIFGKIAAILSKHSFGLVMKATICKYVLNTIA